MGERTHSQIPHCHVACSLNSSLSREREREFGTGTELMLINPSSVVSRLGRGEGLFCKGRVTVMGSGVGVGLGAQCLEGVVCD